MSKIKMTFDDMYLPRFPSPIVTKEYKSITNSIINSLTKGRAKRPTLNRDIIIKFGD